MYTENVNSYIIAWYICKTLFYYHELTVSYHGLSLSNQLLTCWEEECWTLPPPAKMNNLQLFKNPEQNEADICETKTKTRT